MSRVNYDDMESPRRGNGSRGKGGSGNRIGMIAAIAIVICLIAIALYIFLAPPANEEPVSSQEPLAVEVKQVEPVPDDVTVIKEEPNLTVTTVEVPDTEPASEPQPVSGNQSGSQQSVRPSTSPVQAQSISDASRSNSQSSVDSVKYITHVVAEGEDLNSIAEFYGLTPQTLISVNNIRNIATVTTGVTLRIPDRNGFLYTVQDGDILSDITLRYNPDLGWETLMSVNNLNSEIIRPGQTLFIPAPASDEGEVLDAGALAFAPPVEGGSVSALFNQRVNGINLDGVYITASDGAQVVASQKGVVIELGNDRDIGRFIVIQHDDGYKTTYGLLDSVVVSTSAQVEQGDAIGTIGGTLYFKIEQSGIALDPEFFI